MAFMQREIIPACGALEVETEGGTFYIPAEYATLRDGEYHDESGQPLREGEFAHNAPEGIFCSRILAVRALSKGYLGRLSAPGYLDCTDWEYGRTLKEVNAALRS